MTPKVRIYYCVALASFSLFLFFALLSGSSSDWPFDPRASLWEVGNLCGPLGSLAAWAAVVLFGSFFAWVVPLAGFLFAFSLLVGRTRRALTEGLRLGSIALLLGVLFAMAPYSRNVPSLQGELGRQIASGLIGVLGRFGAMILVIALLLVLGVGGAGALGRGLPGLSRLMTAVGRGVGREAWGLAAMARRRRKKRRRVLKASRIMARPGPTAGVGGREEGAEVTPGASFPLRGAERNRVGGERATASAAGETKKPLDEATLPPLSLLAGPGEGEAGYPLDKLEQWGRVLEEKLAYYNIGGSVTGIRQGPMVTTFEFEPAPGVKIKDIVSRSEDLALAMKAKSLRLMAPIPGRSVVGIEIANPQPAIVRLRTVLESITDRQRLSGVMIALGVDVQGKPFTMNLCDAPHLLVAGTTGSGKSVCLHVVITSILCQYRPVDVRLLIVDPKTVELTPYNGIPHLLHPVCTEAKEAVRIFDFLIGEMRRRNNLLRSAGVKNIESYNTKLALGKMPAPAGTCKLPYIVMLVDELGHLVLSKGPDLEALLAKLANMARAVGIHMVVATQRPSVDVIVGKTKANFPTRIAFRVAGRVDSRTILETTGAEKLLGRGDMLFLDSRRAKPIRLHGAFVSEREVEDVVAHWRSYDYEPSFLSAAQEQWIDGEEEEEGERDSLFEQAKAIVIQVGQGSTSLLQRRLKVGYARAARILDQLESEGVVGPPEGSKPREVLIKEEEQREGLP